MFGSVRKRIHLSPTAAIATIALVFAMTGGAYAAKKYLITSTSQISPKVLSALKGKAGPAGAKGAAGAQGAQGPAGPAGSQGPAGPAGSGSEGKQGEPGKPGEPGTSVVATPEAAGASSVCKAGGSKFVTGSEETWACNGKEGSPWTDGGKLPSGATETGSWSMNDSNPKGNGSVIGSISFPIQLASPIASANVQVNAVGYPTGASTTETERCPGSAEKPEAKTGYLCVYLGENTGFVSATPFVLKSGAPAASFAVGANPAGAIVLNIASTTGTEATAYGTWAVTG